MTSKGNTLRPDQKRLINSESKKRNRFVIYNAPTGSGKSYGVQHLAVIDRSQGQRVVIAAPSRIIGRGFTATTLVDGLTWEVSENFLDDNPSTSKVQALKELLLSPVGMESVSSDVVVVTHMALTLAWDSMTSKEQKRAASSTTFVIDEAHHISAVFDKRDTELTKEQQTSALRLQTGIGAFVSDVVSMKNNTARLVLVTATLYRGDHLPILDGNTSEGLRSRFVAYHCPLSEHWVNSDFEELEEFNYLYEHNPLNDAAKVIGKRQDRRHVVFFPPIRKTVWSNEARVQKFIAQLRRLWPNVRVLDLVDQTMQVRSTNTNTLLSQPKTRRQGTGNVDVICVCGIEEGFDWPIADTVHNLMPPRTLPKNAQRFGRMLRRWEGKTRLEVHNYRSANNTAADADGYNKIVKEALLAGVFSLYCDQLVETLFVDKLPLLDALGDRRESILTKVMRGYLELNNVERKDFGTVQDMIEDAARENDVPENYISQTVSKLHEALLIRLRKRHVQEIGLNLPAPASKVFGQGTWDEFMMLPGAGEQDCLVGFVDLKTIQSIREHVQRSAKMSVRELVELILEERLI